MPLSSTPPPPLPPPPQQSQLSSLKFDYFFTMEEFPSGQSPRKQLQGPRPTPLKVRKDSHKIRKPPVFPQQQQPSQPLAPPRPPVIIYTVSPKVIHANPSEFMTLVQRLTGPDHYSTCSSSNMAATSSSSLAFHDSGGAISPAARFASIEKIRSPEGKMKNIYQNDVAAMEAFEICGEVERTTGFFPGILSPNPASLPPIPPSFFSPPASDQNPLGFFPDLSPVLHSNKNYLETSFYMPSPSTFISPRLVSPNISPSIYLFNHFFDL